MMDAQIDLHGPLGVDSFYVRELGPGIVDAGLDTGEPTFPATVHFNSTSCASLSFSSAPDTPTQRARMSHESSILANLRRAQERKRLLEELQMQEKP